MLIDCRSLELTPVPLPGGTAVVILDTATRRGLVDSAYNERRSQCEAAAEYFRAPALRDVGLELFEQSAAGLDQTTQNRALHVITENSRAVRAQRGAKVAARASNDSEPGLDNALAAIATMSFPPLSSSSSTVRRTSCTLGLSVSMIRSGADG